MRKPRSWIAAALSTALWLAAALPGHAQTTIWSERAALPESNSEIAVTELDGRIYVIGGYPSTFVYVDTVEVYEIAQRSIRQPRRRRRSRARSPQRSREP